jgi:polyhydroxybutyrate depolymerase
MKLWRVILGGAVMAGGVTLGIHHVRAGSSDPRGAIRVDGRERTYALPVPKSYVGTKTTPLVIALHGRLGTGEGQERLGHSDKSSEVHGFLVVYPDGLDRSWADGRGASPSDTKGVDDVKFLSELIDKISTEYKIDSAHVYATGMSNGGLMSGRLGCELSEKIAAVGIVGASLSPNVASRCHPEKPVSVLIVQGTKDPLVPFAGGPLRRNRSHGEALSHEAAVQKWVEINPCSKLPKRQHIPDGAGDGTSIEIAAYSGCAGGAQVAGYTVEDGGHTWPGGIQYLPSALIGKTSRNLDASETIWEFFVRQHR